jgi:glycosyltransferase involved in cell wall biosynthesis
LLGHAIVSLNGVGIAVVLPAYNAASTLAMTVAEIDRQVVDEVILVDDGSVDTTWALAADLDLVAIRHGQNRGYGANQKTCYRIALQRGADVVVMLHPDYQYSPRLVPAMAAMIAYGEYDMVLGSRILAQSAVAGGMPRYKYVSNRLLTAFENVIVGAKLSEYHTGLRAYSRALLTSLPFDSNSDDFVFDNQMIVQALMAGARIGELSCPTRYNEEASSINFARSVAYGLGVCRSALEYRLHVWRLVHPAYLESVQRLPPGGGAKRVAPPTPSAGPAGGSTGGPEQPCGR